MNQNQQEKKLKRSHMMLNDPMSSVIPKMALPTIIAFLINSIYSLADAYFVSGLGTNATAAVSVNGSLDQIIMMAGSMLAIGANSYIARLLGKGDNKKASEVLSVAFCIAMIFGALVMIFGFAFMTPMVRLLGATPTCEEYAIQYADYVLLVAPLMAANFVMNQCLRAEGSATMSMIGMGIGGILNIILDPIFIVTLNLGVAGASIATAISKLVSFVILLYPYVAKHSMLHLSLRNFKPTWEIIREIVTVGSSSLFRSGLAVVAAILLNREAGKLSDSVLAGVGVSTRVFMFPFSIILGFGTGFQPVAGFNWGAKRYDRVRESFRFSWWVAIIGGAIMGALVFIFAEPIIGLFAHVDPEMLKIGSWCIRTQCVVLPIHAGVMIVNTFCAGLGNAKGALLLSTSRQGTCFIPILYPITYFFGAYGIASVQAIADLLSVALAIPVLYVTMKKVILAEKEPAA
ncbi:MAG: MATE family efflux transporter [Acetatifactor sp.]|nr:MATE family efflux transporter [Acetatifactor sp.]